jgi:hypothetical protein
VTTYSAVFVAAAGVSFLMWKQVLDKMKNKHLPALVNKEPGKVRCKEWKCY